MKHFLLVISLIVFTFFNYSHSYSMSKNEYHKKYSEISTKKEWAKGELFFREAVKKYPDEITFHTYLNYILRIRKKSREALTQIEEIFKLYPDNRYVVENYKWSLHQYGWDKVKEKKFKTAFKLFKKSYDLISDEQWGINSWGYILHEVGRSDDSIKVLTRGMELFPKNRPIKQNLITAYIKRGNKRRDDKKYEAAEEDFQTALKIDPEYEWTHLNYGVLKRVRGDHKSSLKMLGRSMKRYPKNKYFKPNLIHTIYEYGKSEYKEGRVKKAIAIFSHGNKLFPEEIWFYYFLAEYNIAEDNNVKAARYLIDMASLNSSKKGKDFYHIERTIYHLSRNLFNKMANKKRTSEIFSIINDLKKDFVNQYFIYQLMGEQLYHSGEEKKGLLFVYRAYNALIKKHPEYRKAVSVESPLKGTYMIYGNNSRKAITHAGFHRFSFDFTGSDAKGEYRRVKTGGMGENKDYFGFGAPIYSTCDGIVENIANNEKDKKPSNNYTIVNGNYVSIKDKYGRHHHFAHIKYGSVKVKPGDSVKAGQIIGQLGNSGMTTTPHLHYGVYSKDWVVTLPVNFKSYKLIVEDFTKVKSVQVDINKSNSVPKTNNIILFK